MVKNEFDNIEKIAEFNNVERDAGISLADKVTTINSNPNYKLLDAVNIDWDGAILHSLKGYKAEDIERILGITKESETTDEAWAGFLKGLTITHWGGEEYKDNQTGNTHYHQEHFGGKISTWYQTKKIDSTGSLIDLIDYLLNRCIYLDTRVDELVSDVNKLVPEYNLSYGSYANQNWWMTQTDAYANVTTLVYYLIDRNGKKTLSHIEPIEDLPAEYFLTVTAEDEPMVESTNTDMFTVSAEAQTKVDASSDAAIYTIKINPIRTTDNTFAATSGKTYHETISSSTSLNSTPNTLALHISTVSTAHYKQHSVSYNVKILMVDNEDYIVDCPDKDENNIINFAAGETVYLYVDAKYQGDYYQIAPIFKLVNTSELTNVPKVTPELCGYTKLEDGTTRIFAKCVLPAASEYSKSGKNKVDYKYTCEWRYLSETGDSAITLPSGNLVETEEGGYSHSVFVEDGGTSITINKFTSDDIYRIKYVSTSMLANSEIPGSLAISASVIQNDQALLFSTGSTFMTNAKGATRPFATEYYPDATKNLPSANFGGIHIGEMFDSEAYKHPAQVVNERQQASFVVDYTSNYQQYDTRVSAKNKSIYSFVAFYDSYCSTITNKSSVKYNELLEDKVINLIFPKDDTKEYTPSYGDNNYSTTLFSKYKKPTSTNIKIEYWGYTTNNFDKNKDKKFETLFNEDKVNSVLNNSSWNKYGNPKQYIDPYNSTNINNGTITSISVNRSTIETNLLYSAYEIDPVTNKYVLDGGEKKLKTYDKLFNILYYSLPTDTDPAIPEYDKYIIFKITLPAKLTGSGTLYKETESFLAVSFSRLPYTIENSAKQAINRYTLQYNDILYPLQNYSWNNIIYKTIQSSANDIGKNPTIYTKFAADSNSAVLTNMTRFSIEQIEQKSPTGIYTADKIQENVPHKVSLNKTNDELTITGIYASGENDSTQNLDLYAVFASDLKYEGNGSAPAVLTIPTDLHDALSLPNNKLKYSTYNIDTNTNYKNDTISVNNKNEVINLDRSSNCKIEIQNIEQWFKTALCSESSNIPIDNYVIKLNNTELSSSTSTTNVWYNITRNNDTKLSNITIYIPANSLPAVTSHQADHSTDSKLYIKHLYNYYSKGFEINFILHSNV